jgi:hypothetical protein
MTDVDPFRDWRAWRKAKIAELPAEARDRAVAVLRESLPPETVGELRELIRDDPEDWATPLHFSWGVGVRNLLRSKGVAIGFLDDYYAGLTELAVFDGRWVEDVDR